MYISYVAKARLFTAVFSQLSIFTADCLRHPIQMAGVETIWELHTLPVMYSWYKSSGFSSEFVGYNQNTWVGGVLASILRKGHPKLKFGSIFVP